MNNNSWFKKENPLLGLLGLSVGGGAAGAVADPIEGSGGYVSEYASPGSPTGYYRAHVFVSPGRFRVTTAPGTAEFDLITVGGGGGGGSNNGGGGGAGGYLLSPGIVAEAVNYNVDIGRGGQGRYQAAANSNLQQGGSRGGDTTFETPTITLTAGGGGGGKTYMLDPGNNLYSPANPFNGRSGHGSGGGGAYGPSPGGPTSQTAGPAGASAPAPSGTSYGNPGGAGGVVNICGGGGGADAVGGAGGIGQPNAPGLIQGAGGNGKSNDYALGTAQYFAAGGGGCANRNGSGPISPNIAYGGKGGYGGGGGGGSGGPGDPGGVTTTQGVGGTYGAWGHDGEPGLNTSVPGSASMPYYNNNYWLPDPGGNPGYVNIGGTAAYMTGSGGGGGGGGSAIPTYDWSWSKQVSGGNGAPGVCLVRYSIPAPAATGTATGGLISETPTHRIHTFIGPGTLVTTPTFNSGSDQPTGEIAAVGGGGSGGAHFGGGGGAGRYYTGAFTVRKASTYTIVVGKGGDGGWNGPKIPGVQGSETTITHPVVGTQVYCGGGGGGGTRDGGPTIDKGWPGQGPTSSRGSGGGAGAVFPGGPGPAGAGGSLPGTNSGGVDATSPLSPGGGGGAGGAGLAGDSPTNPTKAGPGGAGVQLPSTFRDSTTCVFGAKGPGSSEDTGSSWGWLGGGGGGGAMYPQSSLPTSAPKYGTGGAAPQSTPPAETTYRQPDSYAGGGGGSGWGGPTSYDPTGTATSSDPYYGRGRAQMGLCGTGGGGGGCGPQGLEASMGSGPGGPGILIIAYPKTS